MSNDRERLLSDAVAGSLSDADQDALADLIERDPALRTELVLQLAVDAWLREAQAQSVNVDLIMRLLPPHGRMASAVMRRVRSISHRPTRASRKWFVSAVAALLLLALTAVIFRSGVSAPTNSPDALSIIERHGHITGDATTTLTLADNARVILAAGDGTKANLGGPAHMQVLRQGGAGGLKFFLDKGRLEVETPARSVARPLTIDTAASHIVVVGTRFTVEANAMATALTVAAGTVRFRPVRGEERIVTAGEHAEATVTRIVRITPSEDAQVNAEFPSGCFPSDPGLTVGQNPLRFAYLRFELPVQHLRSATLVLTRLSGTEPIKAIFVTGPWHETTLTWDNRPEHGSEIGTLATDADGRLRLDVTPVCADGRCDIMLVSEAKIESEIASREAGGGQPVLEIVTDN